MKYLMGYGLVGKKVYDGYPLKVEYFLTKNRKGKILETLAIMQKIGIDFMLENNMIDALKIKGLI